MRGRRATDWIRRYRYQPEGKLWGSSRLLAVFVLGRGRKMARYYRLETKIHALNELIEYRDDLAAASEALDIPLRTLREWRRIEDELRRRHRREESQRLKRIKVDLLTKMLERGQELLARMDAETAANASLSQLASALNVLVSHALKIEETIGEVDEQQQEKVVRFEYYYDDEVQDAPPWAGASEGNPRAVQGGLLRETVGQDGIGEVYAAGEGDDGWDSRLVAGADAADGEPSVARLEAKSDDHRWFDGE